MKNKPNMTFIEQQEYCTDELMSLAEDVRRNACVYSDTDLWCLVDELNAFKTASIQIEEAKSSKRLQKIMRPYLDKKAMKEIFGW